MQMRTTLNSETVWVLLLWLSRCVCVCVNILYFILPGTLIVAVHHHALWIFEKYTEAMRNNHTALLYRNQIKFFPFRLNGLCYQSIPNTYMCLCLQFSWEYWYHILLTMLMSPSDAKQEIISDIHLRAKVYSCIIRKTNIRFSIPCEKEVCLLLNVHSVLQIYI